MRAHATIHDLSDETGFQHCNQNTPLLAQPVAVGLSILVVDTNYVIGYDLSDQLASKIAAAVVLETDISRAVSHVTPACGPDDAPDNGGRKFDVVIADLDGQAEAARVLQTYVAQSPWIIFVVVGSDPPAWIETAMRTVFVSKPYTAEAIVERIAAVRGASAGG